MMVDSTGVKRCYACGGCKPITAFHKRTSSKDGLSGRCKECATEYARAYRRDNPDRVLAMGRKYRQENPEASRESSRKYYRLHIASDPDKVRRNQDRRGESALETRLMTRYGITTEEFESLKAKHDGLCHVCLLVEGKHVDHCHTTGRVRGWLCMHCNLLLGHARDSTDTLAKAIDYLRLT